MSKDPCPSRQELYAYFVGELPEEPARAVMEHVGTCPKCQDVLQTLDDAGDTLLEKLRHPEGKDAYKAEPERQKALDRAKAAGSTPPEPKAVPAPPPVEEEFNPYYRWLGIPPEEQPPHHYRLLGVKPLEEDRVLIESAAEQRVTHLRTFQLGKHSDLSQKLLNQVASAKVCLLDPKRKAAYDEKLREKLGRAATPEQPQSPASLTIPGRLGEYELLAKLGEGGMGVVYKALQTKLGRTVALKVLAQHRLQDAQAVARFEREMKAIGGLNHPNIVQAYDAREVDQMRFLVMEYVDGRDLGSIVARSGPLPVADACELVRQTALGLQCAHEAGLVHRDVKPSNLMLTAKGEVKILDLGLARFQADEAAGEEVTGTGQAMGTLDYMAPEQFSDARSVDIRADIYSLGCTLYKLLVGRAPFSGPDYTRPIDKLVAHAERAPQPIAQLRTDTPTMLALVLGRMLEKKPEERYATPGEVAQALASFCTGADLPALLTAPENANPVPAPKPITETVSRAPAAVKPAFPAIDTGRQAKQAAPKPQPSARAVRTKNRPLLIAVGAAAALVLVAVLATVIIRIRHNDGRETVVEADDVKEVVVAPNQPAPVKPRKDAPAAPPKNVPPRPSGANDSPATLPTATAGDRELEFDGTTSYVQINSLKVDPYVPLTMEGYFTVPKQQGRGGKLLEAHGICLGCSGKETDANKSFRWSMTAYRPGTQPLTTVESDSSFEFDKRTHVALVWDGKSVRLYVDGRQQSGKIELETLPIWRPDPGFTIGACVNSDDKPAFRIFKGRIDEVRISNTARYDGNFTPQARFEPDGDTLALYHFDEGSGDVLHDSSDNRHDGKIVAAQWVNTSPASTPSNEAGWGPAVEMFDGKTLEGWNEKLTNKTSVEDGQIVLDGMEKMAVVVSEGDFPVTNYEVAFEAQRLAGEEGVFLTLHIPVNEDFATVNTGRWNRIRMIDGKLNAGDAASNATQFITDRWYALRLRVTPARIQLFVDDATVIDLPAAGHTFNEKGSHTVSPFAISTNQARIALRNIRLRRCDAAADP